MYIWIKRAKLQSTIYLKSGQIKPDSSQNAHTNKTHTNKKSVKIHFASYKMQTISCNSVKKQ